MLDVDRQTSIDHIKQSLEKQGTPLQGEDLEKAAQVSYDEYMSNIKGVKEVYDGFLFNVQVNKDINNIIEDLKRMVQVKLNSPKRPPRLIILGPPGSGRSSQARVLSQKYGLVHVSTMELLKNEIAKKTERGHMIQEKINAGEMIPDDVITTIIGNRLKQTDCTVNGWVMDGFPKTMAQVKILQDLKVKPSKVVLLECSEDTTLKRVADKKIDPVTGISYSPNDLPSSNEIQERLQANTEDKEDTVKKRYRIWDDFIGKIEEVYGKQLFTIRTDYATPTEITEQISEIVQNPARA